MTHQEDREHILDLTIIVNGIPESKKYPANEKVEEVIKSLLPDGQKQNWNQYILTDNSTSTQLNPAESLEKNGVKSGNLLALTKREGGGGFN